RAMCIDEQAYVSLDIRYRPQVFKDNIPRAQLCIKHLRVETAQQYQREEQDRMLQRAAIIEDRLKMLVDIMAADRIAPPENVRQLRGELANYFQRSSYLRCESMGALVRENLETIRLNVNNSLPPRVGLGV